MQLPCCVVLIGPLVRAESWQNGRAPWCLLALGRRRRSPGSVPDSSRVDDEGSTKVSDEGPPRAPELSARETKERTGRESQNELLCPPRAKRKTRKKILSIHTPPAPRDRPVRERTAPVRPFYNPRMQISGSQRPGGRSHARPLVGRKGGMYLSGSGHLHTRFSLFL